MSKGLIQPATFRSSALILSESALLLGAVAISLYAHIGSLSWPFVLDALPKAIVIMSVCQLCLYYGDLYERPEAGGDRAELFSRTLQALGATSVVLAVLYTAFPALTIQRGVLPATLVLALAGVITWRVSFIWITRQVGPRERLLLVGATTTGLELARELRERHELGGEIVGLVDLAPAAHNEAAELPFLGGIEDIPAVVRARSVDRVVLNLADARGRLPMEMLLQMKLDGVQFEHLTSVYEEYTGKIAVENLRPSWLLFSRGFRTSPRLFAVKRMVDIVSAIVGLLLTAPLILLLAIVIRFTSRGSAFYSQQRVGCEGRIFTVYKLRSMCVDAERDTGPVWSAHGGDSRITRVGLLMRRTRLDELPQFWNILMGHMSLVGPRPERPEFVKSLAKQIPFYGTRHTIKPGLTGWAQVRYTYGATVEDAVQKLQYDLFYIKNLSLKLDLFIIFETVKTVLLRRGQ